MSVTLYIGHVTGSFLTKNIWNPAVSWRNCAAVFLDERKGVLQLKLWKVGYVESGLAGERVSGLEKSRAQ
jgi:hypothetical protein